MSDTHKQKRNQKGVEYYFHTAVYFKPGGYSQWHTSPCLSGQSWFRHKDNLLSQWHNWNFTVSADSLCIHLASFSVCLSEHWERMRHKLCSLSKMYHFFLDSQLGTGKEIYAEFCMKQRREKAQYTKQQAVSGNCILTARTFTDCGGYFKSLCS